MKQDADPARAIEPGQTGPFTKTEPVALHGRKPCLSREALRTFPTITVEEAGAALGLSRAASYAAVKRGDIPVIRVGRRLLVPTARLLRMLGEELPPIEPSRRLDVQGHHAGPLA